jgi:hypothetical protein
MYDGLPLVAKWVTIQTMASATPVKVKIAAAEKLATNWQWSQQGRLNFFYKTAFISGGSVVPSRFYSIF